MTSWNPLTRNTHELATGLVKHEHFAAGFAERFDHRLSRQFASSVVIRADVCRDFAVFGNTLQVAREHGNACLIRLS